MRKLFTTLFIFCSLTTFSQFQRNDHLLSGSINLTTNKTSNNFTPNTTSNFGLGLNISASRFTSERRFNSMVLIFSQNTTKTNPGSINEIKQNSNTGGLSFAHTLLTPLAQRVYLSFPFSFGASASRGNIKANGQVVSKNNAFAAGASATIGVMYLTKKNWVFSANMGSLAGIRYDHTKVTPVSATAPSSKSSSFNMYGGTIGTAFNNLSIGIGYVFR